MFIEIQRGHSFKGTALYCLHDADRAQTSDRVEFAETHNLATSNPHVGWKIMAARHFAQDELKRRAGVGLGGRKNGKPVGHLYISWGQDEAQAQNLNREEMLRSAKGALRAIGAQGHPALIVGHTDTANPHCHIILCLIGEDGRLKSNWKEKEKLSRFALKREIEVHGEPVVKLRERNWKHRLAGEKTPTVKKKPRQLYELDKAAQRDPVAATFAKRHYQQLSVLERRRHGYKDRQGKVIQEGLLPKQQRHRQQLRWCSEERSRRIKSDAQKQVTAAQRTIRGKHDLAWQKLLNRQEAGRHEFRKNETSLLGKAYNVLRYTDWKAVFSRQRETGDRSPSIFSRAFNAISSSGHRQGVLGSRQRQEQAALRQSQQRLEKSALEKIKAAQTVRLEANFAAAVRKSAAMKRRQAVGRGKLQQEQQKLTRQRNQVLKTYREQVKSEKRMRVAEKSQVAAKQLHRASLSDIANRAFAPDAKTTQESEEGKSPVKVAEKAKASGKAKRTRRRKNPSERTNRRHTKTNDLLPKEGSEKTAKLIDQHLLNLAESLQKKQAPNKDQNQGKSQGEGHER